MTSALATAPHRPPAASQQRRSGRRWRLLLSLSVALSALGSPASLPSSALAAPAPPATGSSDAVDEGLLYRSKLQLLQNLLQATAAQAKQNGNYRNYCSTLSIALDVISAQLQRLRTAQQRQQEEQRLNRLRGHYGLCRRSRPAAAPGEFQI